jgi:hypothetical protein
MSDVATATESVVIKPIAELFRADCVAFWAATYNIDLALFNEYLLRRLGDPPLNVAVLCDQRCLDDSLAAIPVERLDLLGPVNRRWLLRGVRVGAGRFHPKSYLAVTARTAKLFIGSGNLKTNGIDSGREVFTPFVSGTPIGDGAIATWRSWMRRLIAEMDDTVLAERFTDLEARLPESKGLAAVADSPIWHNMDTPFIDQFCAGVGARPIDELIVTAPFYDEQGEALGQLVDRLKPTVIRLYFSESTKVDGHRLAARLSSTGAEVQVMAYLPDRFTHAKLVGVTAGTRGWLMSGSANLSHRALTLSADPGNVELVVFAAFPADLVRAAFIPPDVVAEARQLSDLGGLSYGDGDAEVVVAPLVRIIRASFTGNGRVQVATDPAPEADWRLADHESAQRLAMEGTTVLTDGPLLGPRVHVVSPDGTVLSNPVVVDDPVALARILEVGERAGSSHPVELTAADLETPLGAALLHVHQTMFMDVNDRTGAAGAGGLRTDEARGGDEDENLWTRLEQEILGRDPRAGNYPRLLGRGGEVTGVAEPIVELLEAMQARVPVDPRTSGRPPSLLQLLADKRAGRGGHQWSTTARVRVRARNVLRRWAAAQTDPRLDWVDPLAPLGNLAIIAAVFVTLWREQAEPEAVIELDENDLDDLWARWFRPFVGTGQSDGWLDRTDVPPDRLAEVIAGGFSENVTALCWLAIRTGNEHRARVVSWQPALRAGFDKGIISDSHPVAEYLSSVVGYTVTTDEVADDLIGALAFIDDPLWCEQTAVALDLEHLELATLAAGQAASVQLKVRGVSDPLYDPRVPQLIVAVRRYRSVDAVAVYSQDPDHPWRLVVTTGESAAFLEDLDGDTLDSVPLEAGVIEGLAAVQGVIADLFRRHPAVA